MTDLETKAVAEIATGLIPLALMYEVIVDVPGFMNTIPDGEK